MKEKALIIFSGGQDSTTCLYWALQQGFEVHTITFDYGQRHQIEIEAAQKIARKAGLSDSQQEICRLGPILKSTSPLLNDDELDSYADSDDLPEAGVEKTFVPMRNQFFLTLAANRAYALGCTHMVTGVSQADYGGYPDCREDFIKSFEKTCNLGSFTGEPGVLGNLKVWTPLMHLSKAETVKLAYELPGCVAALAWSHTAYDGQYPPLGHDHASVLRAKGFAQAGRPDPLVLRAHHEGLMDLPHTSNYQDKVLEQAIQQLESENWLA